MSDKPSLYVVEKKEVIILVILFVLVTVLSFTVGVRYGESVGKKAAEERNEAVAETGSADADKVGGKLGAAAAPGAHGEAAANGHEAHAEHGAEPEKKAEPAHGEAAAPTPAENKAVVKETEKNSDEFLLNALKDSGIESPGGKAPGNAKLPQETKSVRSGTYVIQVGSHPTRSEAESQIRQLRAKKVEASVLAPFKDRQGEWHRVVVGSYKTKRDAEREAAQLKGRGAILSFFVWRLP